MKGRTAQAARRVKTPTVLQMEALECGAASLAMILAYYKYYVPLDKLRVDCGVSRDGSRALYIVRAARKYGLEANGWRKSIDDLKQLPPPYIAYWENNHFLVVEGFWGGKVYLNDPASGRRVLTEDEFARSYSGIVLTMTPGPNFRPAGQKPSIWPALRQRLRGNEIGLTFVTLVGLLLVIPGVVIPNFIRSFVDNILLSSSEHWLLPLLYGMGLTAVLQGALVWMQQAYLLRLETRMALTSSARFFWHILRLPVEFFAQRFSAEVGRRVQLNDSIAQLLGGTLSANMLNLFSATFFLIMMVLFSPLLTGIGLVAVGLNFLFLRLVTQQNTLQNERLLQEQSKGVATAMAGLRAIETLKASGSESDFFSQWAGYQAKVINLEQQVGVMRQYLANVPNLLYTLSNTAILVFGGMQVIQGDMTIGSLVAFQNLMIRFMDPVTSLVNLGATVQQTVGDMNRLEDVLKYPVQVEVNERRSEEQSSSLEHHSAKLKGYVELRNVTFGYNRMETPLIENFNLRLAPGRRIALVGGSGSGKSTVARIVSGLYEPWSGEILFDGKPRHEWPRALIYNSVSIVDQEIHLFAGTLRENLTLWDATVSEADLIQAAKDACIHNDIVSRPAGYSELLIEGGVNFSGGQRQRLEIARALVTNPSVLILDEATSALDPKTEQEIDRNLRRRGCACIIVAHRLSTIRDCDEIIVLEHGRVVQRGTHEEMANVDGPYAQLISMHA